MASFRGDRFFLSNFYRVSITVAGITFPTVEHAFVASKYRLDEPDRRAKQAAVARLKTPAEAKRFGRTVPLRADWKQNHVGIMRALLKAKFADRVLAERLVATGTQPLIEVNEWGDTYWGVCNGRGRNMLGMLLMEIREVISDPLYDQLDYEQVEEQLAIRKRRAREDDPSDMGMSPDERHGVDDPSTQQALDLHDAC